MALNRKHIESKLLIAGLITLQGFFMAQGFMSTAHTEVLIAKASVAQETVVADYTQPQVPIKSDQDNLVEHILNVFGKEGWKAVAIARCESGLGYWKVLSTKNEHSVGIFQINIAKDYGHGKHVHWSKIKGETLEEKEKALKDPLYNVEIAKQIYDRSGWRPWSTFKNNCYKNFY